MRKRKDKWTGLYLNAMLEAVELPARVSDLDTGLADVDRDALPHGVVGRVGRRLRLEMGRGEKLESRREASTKTPFSAVLCLGFVSSPLGSFYKEMRTTAWATMECR
nr:unnamed protein product [Digitaria exilis]